jgi:hypothetical protein
MNEKVEGKSNKSKRGGKRIGSGRKKGKPNTLTALLKDAVLKAAENAGGEEGIVGYLQTQAILNAGPFMGLLGKVLPLQISGDPDNPVPIMFQTLYENQGS